MAVSADAEARRGDKQWVGLLLAAGVVGIVVLLIARPVFPAPPEPGPAPTPPPQPTPGQAVGRIVEVVYQEV